MTSIEKILCPVDFSEPSEKGLELARSLAARLGAELHIMHSIDVAPVIATPRISAAAPVFDVSGYRKALMESAEERLAALADHQETADVRVTTHLAEGAAAHEIIDLAAKLGVDMIVIATHGHSGWRRLIFGSVTEKVVRTAPCPVLTVNEREAKE
jgi:universal stress protein A